MKIDDKYDPIWFGYNFFSPFLNIRKHFKFLQLDQSKAKIKH